MNDLFIVISTKVTQNMYTHYSKISDKNLIFISDKKPEVDYDNIYCYTNHDELIKQGYTGMHSKYKITSWDKAFYHIEQLIATGIGHTNYWVIEDDCYINYKEFIGFTNEHFSNPSDHLCFGWLRKFIENDKWAHWKKRHKFAKQTTNKYQYFSDEDTCATINQIVRLSPKCISEISTFRKKYNKYLFHEMFFVSIANSTGLTHELIKIAPIHLRAMENVSLKHRSYPSMENKDIIPDLEDFRYIAVHPFKKWYNGLENGFGKGYVCDNTPPGDSI